MIVSMIDGFIKDQSGKSLVDGNVVIDFLLDLRLEACKTETSPPDPIEVPTEVVVVPDETDPEDPPTLEEVGA